MSAILSLAQRIVKSHYLCNNCLGRMFAGLSTGLSNRERGEIILEMLVMDLSYKLFENKRIDKKLLSSLIAKYKKRNLIELVNRKGVFIEYLEEDHECEICGGLIDKIEVLSSKIVERLKEYSFETFSVGIEKMPDIEKREDNFRIKYGVKYGENIRNEISREIGKRVKLLTNLRYEETNPDMQILVNPLYDRIIINTKKLVITGLLLRKNDIPVFSKRCKSCRGAGCSKCSYTGKQPDDSIEYNFGEALLKLSDGSKWKFGVEYKDDKVGFRFSISNPKKKMDRSKIMDSIKGMEWSKNIEILDINIIS